MKILALDQAPAKTGWAMADGDRLLSHGVLKTPTDKQLNGCTRERWQKIAIRELAHQYAPDVIALEGVFYSKNADTLIRLSEFKGRLEGMFEDIGTPTITVFPREESALLGMGSYASRDPKKLRTRIWAAMRLNPDLTLVDPDDLPAEDLADALLILEVAQRKLAVNP